MAKALREAKAKAPKLAADAPKETSGPEAAQAAQGQDAPSSGAAAGTNTSSESNDQGGAGDTAGSAGSLKLDDALDALGNTGAHLDTEAEFRARFPRMSAELDAWKSENGDEVPSGVRIRSKVDGFRRAGIAHPKVPVEHQLSAFTGPEQIEALFAEPNLVVELI
ncbi:HI1506-related protein [Mesorhizobium sp. M0222]|uniref:HI1506-related protein n=1 Tax=Mesorhizobium sp. M0222 TaxID=2956921 RepID=UPI00333BBA31